MKSGIAVVLVALSGAPGCAWAQAPQAATAGPPLEEIASGVYALVRPEPLGLANHANDVFVVGRRGVLVIDTAFTLAATREALASLREHTSRPVLYVVNTHWHDDHIFGDQVYQDAFPGARFVAQSRTRDDMAGIAVENRRRQVEGGPAAVATFQRAVDQGKALDGRPLSDSERRAYLSTIALAQQFFGEAAKEFRAVTPDTLVNDHLQLDLGDRRIDLQHLGPAVTNGDLVAWLPRERILVAGDIVNYPFPFTYGCDLDGWIGALERIEALGPRLIVPGHGPVLRGTAHVQLLLKLLRAIRTQVDAALARGDAAGLARRHVDLRDYRRTLAGDDPMLGFLFDNYFAAPAIDAALKARAAAGA